MLPCGGVSNKHCLLSVFSFVHAISPMLFCYMHVTLQVLNDTNHLSKCVFWGKTTVFQPEILSNHHGNHFLGFMVLVEEKNQNPFTKLHTLVSTIKWQSIIKN